MNDTETVAYIHSLGMFSHEASLTRITALLGRLGNPQNACPSVHIAGTNGKGSTAVMTASAFRAAGLRTGLFISPFVIGFCERIQVDGEFIPAEELIRLSRRVIDTGIAVTEFEFITAVGFLYFAARKCDVTVIETGLGGRLDATNTMDCVRVSVITKIGLDHTALLGDTLEKIAAEKCGIIRNDVTVSAPGQDEAALGVIRAHARRLIIPSLSELKVVHTGLDGNSFFYRGEPYETALGGEFQIGNALTAIETVRHAGFPLTGEELRRGLAAARFPARLEVIRRNPLLVLDGAHNPDGAAALAAAMQPYAGAVTGVTGMMRDKNYEKFLSTVLPLCRRVVAVRASDSPRALSAAETAAAASAFCAEVCTADSYADALHQAFSLSAGGPVFIFGSLYLAAGIRPLLPSD